MSKLEAIYRTNNVNLLNSTYFDSYEENKEFLKGKIFLYSEIHPKDSQILKIRNINYQIGEVFDIEVVGNLANPKRSLRTILTSCYKCKEFMTFSTYDGCLFIYNGFKSSEEEFKISESAVQLKFRVYKLIKI